MDFLVIGAQKAGTTTLWEHLRSHPELALTAVKEAAFFSHDDLYAKGLDAHMERHFRDAKPGLLRGTVVPYYMMGTPEAPVSEIARRIHMTLPGVRLIAILRDPLARAQSGYRMSVRRGIERRDIARALTECLTPQGVEAGRERPDQTNSYIAQSEYGRILSLYLRFFERDQLLVLFTDDLQRQPAQTMRRAFAFLGVDESHQVPDPELRAFVGGDQPRVDDEAIRELHTWFKANVSPELPHLFPAFKMWLKTWNVQRSPAPAVPPDLSAALRRHFERDRRRLARIGVHQTPWDAQLASGWQAAGS